MHATIVDRTAGARHKFFRIPVRRPRVSIILLAATLLVSLFTSIYVIHRYLGFHPGGTLYNLDNAWGPLIKSLRESGTYAMCKQDGDLFWSYFWGNKFVCFTAHRLPAIGYFLTLLSFLTPNLYIASIAKNLIFYSISFYTAMRVGAEYKLGPIPIALALAALLLMPMNAAVAAALASEEGYSYHLVPLLFALLFLVRKWRRSDLVIIALVIGILSMTKSSYFIVCLLAAFVALVRRPDTSVTLGWVRGLPLIILLGAMLGWGIFTEIHSGRFAFGPGMSSINGLNFYKGNNPYVELYYPVLHLDREDYDGVTKPDIEVENEWQADDYYRGKALDFIRENPEAALRMLLARVRVAFLSIEQAGIFPESGHRPGIALTMIPTRIIFLLGAALAAVMALRARDGSLRFAAFGFLGLIAAFSAPYLAAFVWYRHMMPVYATAIVYLLALWGSVESGPGALPRLGRRERPAQ